MRPEAARVLPDPGSAAQELMALLAKATGNVRLQTADSPVLEKVRSRLVETGLASFDAYLDLLKSGEGGRNELETLIAGLTVGETFFFRQPEHFAAFRDVVLPACLARNAASRQVRIWSAGCANGAEPYSMAILLHALLGDELAGWNVTIVASDINRTFLREAEAGTYSAWSLRGLERKQLVSFFEKSDAGWRLRDRYRRRVRFVQHNLIGDDVPSHTHNIHDFDVVFCRNVMLYFDDAANRIAVAHLESALVGGGFLFVAPTDVNPHLNATFSSEKAAGVALYRKRLSNELRDLAAAAERGAARERDLAVRPRAARPDKPRSSRPIRAAKSAPRRSRPEPAATTTNQRAAAPTVASIAALADRGDVAEAGRLAKAMLDADPLNSVAYFYDALVGNALGKSAAAEASFRRAIYLDRSFALAHYHLALLRAEAGDRAAALKGFLNVVDLLAGLPRTRPASPDGEIDAGTLRALAIHQIENVRAL